MNRQPSQPRIGVAISVLAFIVSAGSLWVARDALLNSQLQSRNQTRSTVFSQSESIQDLLIRDPALYDYLYLNKPLSSPLTGTDKKALMMAEMFLDLIDHVSTSTLPPTSLQGWREYAQDIYRTSPAVRELYQARSKWYPNIVEKQWLPLEQEKGVSK